MVTFSHVNKKALENSSKYWQLLNLQLIASHRISKGENQRQKAITQILTTKISSYSFWDSDLVFRLKT